MAQDIYGRAGNQFGGAFAADAAKVVFSSGAGTSGDLIGPSGGVGLVTQSTNINYSQQISRIYEVGSDLTFLIAGRTQGQLSVARVLGPSAVQTAFYSNYGNVCNAANNNISVVMSTGCPTGANQGIGGGLGTLAFLILNVVIVNLGLSVAAQDMIFNEQFQAMYVSLGLNN